MTAATQHATCLMPRWVADYLAAAAVAALLAELETWPKPGLVSHLDSGSHSDMDASTFRASAIAIAPFFGQLAVAGAAGCDMDGLREIGVEAERAMLAATGGINTHRGAIFGLGLLCAAAGAAWSGSAHARWDWRAKVLAATVTQRWGLCDIARTHPAAQPWDECAAPIWRGRCAGTGCSWISDRTRRRSARAAPRPPPGTWRSGGRSRPELLRNHGVDGGHQPASSRRSRRLALCAGRSCRVSPAGWRRARRLACASRRGSSSFRRAPP